VNANGTKIVVNANGTKIAFAGGLDLDTDGEIYIVNADGTGLTHVTHTGGSQSPDGARTR